MAGWVPPVLGVGGAVMCFVAGAVVLLRAELLRWKEEREEEVLEKRSWERIYSKVRSLLAFLVQKYIY